MVYEQHFKRGGKLVVSGYAVHDPEDHAILVKKVAQLNALEAECQAEEKLGERDVCFTVANDFLARPQLYKKCILALVEEADHPECERPILAVAVFAVKAVHLDKRVVNSAFGFLSRTRPSARRSGAFKLFYACLPNIFARLRVENCFGYIHQENEASLSMNRHTPVFGSHHIVLTETRKVVDDSPPLELVGTEAGTELLDDVYGENDLALAEWSELLDHDNHLGMFTVKNSFGVAGVCLWDMTSLGKLAIKNREERFPYMLCHTPFFLPSKSFDAKVHAGEQLKLMEKLVQGVQAMALKKFGVSHLMWDIDQTNQMWLEYIERSCAIVGRTDEHLSGWGVNRIEPSDALIKRFLDPRDFSTLLFFQEGNTLFEVQESEQANPSAKPTSRTLVAPRDTLAAGQPIISAKL